MGDFASVLTIRQQTARFLNMDLTEPLRMQVILKPVNIYHNGCTRNGCSNIMETLCQKHF